MTGPLDSFLPAPDARERFAVTVKAPPDVVYDVAAGFDMQSVGLIRTILRARERFLGSQPQERPAKTLLAEMESLGWGCLVSRPGELFVAGAVCQPWLADVVFTPVPAAEFAGYAVPGQVKIAWTLETSETEAGGTRLATETRAAATDDQARARFRRYWRWARFGIFPIRWLLLPAIRSAAEQRWRTRQDALSQGRDTSDVNPGA
jgi:hypothetical protein